MAKVKASAATLDFTNVKEAGNFNKKHYPSGDYLGKVMKVEDAKSKEGGDPMWLFTIKVQAGTYPYYCKLNQDNQLWKIRNLMVAAGAPVPKKRQSVDPNRVVGAEIGVTLDETEYKDKLQSEVAAVFPASELDQDDSVEATDDEEDVSAPADEEEEEPTPKAKKKKKGKKAKASDDEMEELDVEDM
jgi:hypothetical protein